MTLEGYQFLVIRHRVSRRRLHTLQRTAILQTDLHHIAASSTTESESSQRFGCLRTVKAGVTYFERTSALGSAPFGMRSVLWACVALQLCFPTATNH